MRFIKKILGAALGLAFFLVCAVGAFYFAFYDSRQDFLADYQSLKRAATIELYERGYIDELSRKHVVDIYQKNCYRQCHGESAMITAVLSPAGWIQVVERMRVKEGVSISGKEADAIIQYLEETYPTVKSKYSFETRKKVHHAVWRNDMGQGDIYCDVIYATPEYLESIGAEHLIKEYDVANYHVFITSFTVHEGEIEIMDLDKLIYMRSPNGQLSTTPPWNLRFQTADKHHFEGVVRFSKKAEPRIVDGKTPWFELVIQKVGGPDNRIYRWDLPISYPEEIPVRSDGGAA